METDKRLKINIMIKALDTYYDNHYFRSRLEARWALYFNELGVEWQYEKEGFDLGDGIKYLPDFYLPRWSIYAEIKPIAFTNSETDKCERLAKLTEKYVIQLVGLPNLKPISVIVPFKGKVCPKCNHSEYYNWDNVLIKCDCNLEFIESMKTETADAILLLNSAKESYMPLYYCTSIDDYHNNPIIHKAIHDAKCARFEHGESGTYPKHL